MRQSQSRDWLGSYTFFVFEFLMSSEVEDGELVFSVLYLQAGRLL